MTGFESKRQMAKNKLEQPEQEPVAWMFQHDETGRINYVSNDGMNTPKLFLKVNPRYALVCPLYTAPPVYFDEDGEPSMHTTPPAAQRPWRGLTDAEAHKTLLGMAEHIELFGDANTTDQQLSAECIRFILDQVAAHNIKEQS